VKKVWERRSHAFPPHYTPDSNRWVRFVFRLMAEVCLCAVSVSVDCRNVRFFDDFSPPFQFHKMQNMIHVTPAAAVCKKSNTRKPLKSHTRKGIRLGGCNNHPRKILTLWSKGSQPFLLLLFKEILPWSSKEAFPWFSMKPQVMTLF